MTESGPPVLTSDPVGYLRHFLPEDYLPPYGTPLTPETFASYVDHGFGVIATDIACADGGATQYILQLRSQTEPDGRELARCETEGYIHPYTRKKLEWVPVEDWYDFLLVKDAQARQEAREKPQLWEDDDVEGQLYRAEQHIVSFGEDSSNTENFTDAAGFREWLNQVVESSPATFDVGALIDVQRFQEKASGTLLCSRHKEEDDGSTTLVGSEIPGSLNIREGRPTSPHDLGDDIPCEMDFTLSMDGPEVERFHGDYVTFFSRTSDCFATDGEDPDWYGITVQGTGIVMPVPAAGAIITVSHDRDGAAVRVEVACQAHAERRNRLEDAYLRRWGRWLDEDVALTESEIAQGIAEAETALEERRAAEARGESIYGRVH